MPQGTPTAATVATGQTANFSFQLSGTGASQTVALSCTGAPQGATCKVPATVTVIPGTAVNVNVGVSTTARGFLVPGLPSAKPPMAWPLVVSLIALLLISLQWMRKQLKTMAQPAVSMQFMPRAVVVVTLAVLIASAAWLSGCAGGAGSSGPTAGTPQGTSTITVTATSNGVSRSTQFTLTVN